MMREYVTASMKLLRPDEMRAELKITMDLGDWKKLRDQLSGQGFPAADLVRAINGVINKASDAYHESIPREEEDA